MDVESGTYFHNITTETNAESQDTSENMRYLNLAFAEDPIMAVGYHIVLD